MSATSFVTPTPASEAADRRRALAARYERLAATGRAVLANRHVVPDPLPCDGDARWGVSAVFRVRPWGPALAMCAANLALLLGRGHAVYGPQASHLTLRQFEGYRDGVGPDDPRVAAYAAVLTDVVAAWPPVTVALRGLVATPTGVVMAGWPGDDLQALRRALHDRLAAAGLAAGPEEDGTRLRDNAHVSLAIYGGSPARAAAVAAWVERHRDTGFGSFVFGDVAIVGYRRTREHVSLVEYGVARFGKGGSR